MMNIFIFAAGATALTPYFRDTIGFGLRFQGDPGTMLARLRQPEFDN